MAAFHFFYTRLDTHWLWVLLRGLGPVNSKCISGCNWWPQHNICVKNTSGKWCQMRKEWAGWTDGRSQDTTRLSAAAVTANTNVNVWMRCEIIIRSFKKISILLSPLHTVVLQTLLKILSLPGFIFSFNEAAVEGSVPSNTVHGLCCYLKYLLTTLRLPNFVFFRNVYNL